MASVQDSRLFVSTAQPVQQAEALALVFASQPDGFREQITQATLEAVRRGDVCLDGLFVATRNDQIVGAAWCQQLPGRVAAVWPAQVASGESASIARDLMVTLCQRLAPMDVDLAQAVLADSQATDAELLTASGFVHVTELLFLVCLLNQSHCKPQSTELWFEPIQEASWPRLASIVHESYIGTMDCPALNGVRKMDDVLEGYRHVGSFDPQRWFIVRHNDDDVGCLLLNDHPEAQQYELVYMGLLPQARGNRWGREITRQAQWLTHTAGRTQLMLAVDMLNRPAISAYSAAGFEICDRRSVFFLRVG